MERLLVDSARLAVRCVQEGGRCMKKRLIRLVVTLGASVGLVAVVADAAYARITGNHCEPVR